MIKKIIIGLVILLVVTTGIVVDVKKSKPAPPSSSAQVKSSPNFKYDPSVISGTVTSLNRSGFVLATATGTATVNISASTTYVKLVAAVKNTNAPPVPLPKISGNPTAAPAATAITSVTGKHATSADLAVGAKVVVVSSQAADGAYQADSIQISVP